MKPLKIMMRAFGPYKNEEIIDFTKLHENGIFVISGMTGAGKTTIFDGICFALYGNGSGQDRKDVKMLRSDFADDHVHTAVELVFELRGKKYRVFRQLAHVKKGKKAATGDKYEFFEILDSGEEIPVVERQKVTDINKKIEELIGLTYDQFSQIVMLPQGEFRKLLTSQSDNKEAILRKIFKTNRYGKMVAKLEEKKRDAEQKLNEAKSYKDALTKRILGALPERESLLFAYLKQESNIYQIIEGLEEENIFYERKILEDEKTQKKAEKNYKIELEKLVEARALNERIENFEAKVKQLEQAEKERPIYEQKKIELETARKASNLIPLDDRCNELSNEKQSYEKQLKELTISLENAETELKEIEQCYQIEKEKQNERDLANQKVLELEKLRPLFEEIGKLEKNVNSLQKEKNTIQKTINQIDENLTTLQNNISDKQKHIETLDQEVEKLPTILEQQMKLENNLKLIEECEKLKLERDKLKKELEEITGIWCKEKEAYETEERNFLNNQIAQIAKTLVPGQPCPVCGSTHHNPVHIEIGDVIDEKQLNSLKIKLSKREQEKFKIEGNLSAKLEQYNETVEKLKKENIIFGQHEQLKTTLNEIKGLVNQLQKDRATLQKEKESLKNFEQQLKDFEQKKKENENKLNEKSIQLTEQSTILQQKRSSIPSEYETLTQLEKAMEEAITLRDTLQKAWEQVQEELKNGEQQVIKLTESKNNTTNQLQQTKEKLQQAMEKFQDEMKKASFETYEQYKAAIRSEDVQNQLQNEYSEFMNNLHHLTRQVEEEREQLNGKEKIDVNQLEEKVNTLKLQYEQASQMLTESKNYQKACQDFINNLNEISERIVQLEQNSNQIIKLYDLLRGQNSKKISFERYVLMGYLEQITEAANIRLRNLSNGQYYLQCSDRLESHGRQSGLSLDVYDAYTGQTRDVKTLSGGEKFNASLSLALGMADIIQSYQGNVVIDTMFIDEGFGSLDEESLMKAIDTLIDLQKTGRLIGVISHVSELKDAMPAILQVEKLKEGYSKTSIIIKN